MNFGVEKFAFCFLHQQKLFLETYILFVHVGTWCPLTTKGWPTANSSGSGPAFFRSNKSKGNGAAVLATWQVHWFVSALPGFPVVPEPACGICTDILASPEGCQLSKQIIMQLVARPWDGKSKGVLSGVLLLTTFKVESKFEKYVQVRSFTSGWVPQPLQSGWEKVLKFRPASTHSECHVCHRLKKEMREAKTMASHVSAADRYLRHLSGQWADRTVYWQARSRAKSSKDVLVMMADGMDKGKYHLPRWTSGRAPKAAESLSRPACEVYATLLHGRTLHVFVADCDQTCGSNFVIEVVTRTLDKAFREAQKTGSSWPTSLQIWSDNTPKDCVESCHAMTYIEILLITNEGFQNGRWHNNVCSSVNNVFHLLFKQFACLK